MYVQNLLTLWLIKMKRLYENRQLLLIELFSKEMVHVSNNLYSNSLF